MLCTEHVQNLYRHLATEHYKSCKWFTHLPTWRTSGTKTWSTCTQPEKRKQTTCEINAESVFIYTTLHTWHHIFVLTLLSLLHSFRVLRFPRNMGNPSKWSAVFIRSINNPPARGPTMCIFLHISWVVWKVAAFHNRMQLTTPWVRHYTASSENPPIVQNDTLAAEDPKQRSCASIYSPVNWGLQNGDLQSRAARFVTIDALKGLHSTGGYSFGATVCARQIHRSLEKCHRAFFSVHVEWVWIWCGFINIWDFQGNQTSKQSNPKKHRAMSIKSSHTTPKKPAQLPTRIWASDNFEHNLIFARQIWYLPVSSDRTQYYIKAKEIIW